MDLRKQQLAVSIATVLLPFLSLWLSIPSPKLVYASELSGFRIFAPVVAEQMNETDMVSTAKITVSPHTVRAGTSVSIAGSGFGKQMKGSVTFNGIVVATFTTSGAGKFSLMWTIPMQTPPGTYIITASTASASANAALVVQQPTVIATPVPTATATPSPTATPVDTTTTTPTTNTIALGASITDAPWQPAKIDEFATLVGAMPAIVMWYQDWAHSGVKAFDPIKMNAVVERGAMPMVTWEPWDYTKGVKQPEYALRTILAGNHDAYIRQWARDATAWGKPFYLRFAHEMNGTWYPWSPGVNGNTRDEYVAAWRHIVDIFRQAGATNVRWVWCPMVNTGNRPFSDLYPGDAYVDWVGLDGYNWGTTSSGSSWREFANIFESSYKTLAALTTNPILIGEMASTEVGGDKAAWIRQGLLNDLPSQFPQIHAVIWFDRNKETDWRVNSSPAALDAFREVVAAPSYQRQLP